MPQIDPEFLDSDEVHAAVNALDIGALYRLANRLGVSQRKIAELTDQTQSEVWRDPQRPPGHQRARPETHR